MKTKKLIITFILTGVVGFVVGKTVFDSVKTDSENTQKIQSILNENCNCESIEKSIYAKGVQYSNNQGFTTETVDFILTNCKYDTLNEEGERIAKILNKEGFATFNLITLDFISDEKQETITIKNGKIQ
jgi:hypothetical protein